MAQATELPCDGDGVCMVCKVKPSEEENLTCKTCATPWHVNCLSSKPEKLADTIEWECPDCSSLFSEVPPVPAGADLINGPGESSSSGGLVAAIRAIEADPSLTEKEKAKRRQELLSGKSGSDGDEAVDGENDGNGEGGDGLDILNKSLMCVSCIQLPDRPVTTPCGHNFCLKCFQKWINQSKDSCMKCRKKIPLSMAKNPRINSALVSAIRLAKMSKNVVNGGPPKVYHFIHQQDRPDKAFTTERAQKSGKANAASGKIFVTVPQDHFGPILAINDPLRNQGVMVGECWEDRLECRQWGVHFPHVAGIAGQSDYGAQSVVLSGGYIDDEDHGEWFLYTGSGGRDLSGNKRTNKDQSFDQTFEKYNKALQVSCLKGYPVRVVRSHKEKRSAYAPEKNLRYDGIYRIEMCWRKVGNQGFKVCRYLFVRCDNDPAPWTSDEHGDRPRKLPNISELKKATDLCERKGSSYWDFDENDLCWKWKKPPPPSKKPVASQDPETLKIARRAIRRTQQTSVRDKLLREFSCSLCKKVMELPVTTPCAHNFCKSCLDVAFAGRSAVRDRSRGGRSLRTQKNVLNCPSCPTDVSDFLQNIQVNRELQDLIESLKSKAEENEKGEESNGEESNADPESENAKAGTEKDGVTGLNDGRPEKPEAKRRKIAGEEGSSDSLEKPEKAMNEGNNSPSSPLHVRSDGDMND